MAVTNNIIAFFIIALPVYQIETACYQFIFHMPSFQKSGVEMPKEIMQNSCLKNICEKWNSDCHFYCFMETQTQKYQRESAVLSAEAPISELVKPSDEIRNHQITQWPCFKYQGGN